MATTSKASNDGILTSFFISNFHENYQVKDLLAVFKTYGEAREVFTPPRRGKTGRRFGFVWFQAVKEPNHFAVKLDNIVLENMKLLVNQLKFEREGVGIRQKKHANVVGLREPKKAPVMSQAWIAKNQ